MRNPDRSLLSIAGVLLAALASCRGLGAPHHGSRPTTFDIKDYGATGRQGDDARPAIQSAIDACAAAGGGTVLFPPGDYTSGTIELRSRVRLWLEAGATIHSAKGKASFPKEALLFGQDLEHIAVEGFGTVDGHAAYEWRENDIEDRYIYPNLVLTRAAGKSLRRSFPTPDSAGHLVRLVRCRDVQFRTISLLRSPSWTMHLWGCERVVIDGVFIQTSLSDGVWADGIDPDGCRDVRISNCTIETGDDALVFYSTNLFGPARPCEDITVTNCRLTSSSSAIKFCDGNQNCVRRVAIDNCVITNSNRGIAFMVFDGGYVSDVAISNIVIECTRRDWFWWGDGDPIHFNVKRRTEIDPNYPADKDLPAGSIRNVSIRNVVARGMGSSLLTGHASSPLENISIDGLDLHLSCDPAAPYEKTRHALELSHAKNIQLRNVRVYWEDPSSKQWESAISVRSVERLAVDGFRGRQAHDGSDHAAVVLEDVKDANITNCVAADGTTEFVRVRGSRTAGIRDFGNDVRRAKAGFASGPDVEKGAILRY